VRKGVRGEERCTYREHIKQSAAPAGQVPIARERVALGRLVLRGLVTAHFFQIPRNLTSP
jgi:hypothetical protein